MNDNGDSKDKDDVTWVDVLCYLIATVFFMLIATGLYWLVVRGYFNFLF